MKIKFDYRKYLFLRVSFDHDEKSEFLTIDIIPLSFSYKVNFKVEYSEQFTGATWESGKKKKKKKKKTYLI